MPSTGTGFNNKKCNFFVDFLFWHEIQTKDFLLYDKQRQIFRQFYVMKKASLFVKAIDEFKHNGKIKGERIW